MQQNTSFKSIYVFDRKDEKTQVLLQTTTKTKTTLQIYKLNSYALKIQRHKKTLTDENIKKVLTSVNFTSLDIK